MLVLSINEALLAFYKIFIGIWYLLDMDDYQLLVYILRMLHGYNYT